MSKVTFNVSRELTLPEALTVQAFAENLIQEKLMDEAKENALSMLQQPKYIKKPESLKSNDCNKEKTLAEQILEGLNKTPNDPNNGSDSNNQGE